jgi:hypothetical protein
VPVDKEDIRQRRPTAVSSHSRPQLTEQTLLQLEQSLPNYRLAQRNLNHWFFYIESTVQDTFDTFRGLPDPDFIPSISSPPSVVPLSQADFQESHHSPAGSSDLFGFTVRSPREIQVILPSRSSTAPVNSPSRTVSPSADQPSPQEADFAFFEFSSESPSLSPPPSPPLPSKASSSDSDPPYIPPRPRKRRRPITLSSVEIIEIPDSASDSDNVI